MQVEAHQLRSELAQKRTQLEVVEEAGAEKDIKINDLERNLAFAEEDAAITAAAIQALNENQRRREVANAAAAAEAAEAAEPEAAA